MPFLLTPFLHLGDLDNPKDKTRRQYTGPHLRWLLQQADGIFAQTESERQAIVAMGIPEERVVLQGLGVDFGKCTGGSREKARQAWKVDAEMPVVGLLANHSWDKGSIDLCHAMTQVWRRGLRAKLVLAGPEMPAFTNFWARFQDQIPSDHGIRLGMLDDEQKKDFFAGIDLFVLPSRSDSFGLVLLEAWANGVPNIGYRAGGIANVIRNEQDGLLTTCEIIPLANAIERLLRDANLRREYGMAGKKRAEKDFKWADKLSLVRRQYQQCAFAKVL